MNNLQGYSIMVTMSLLVCIGNPAIAQRDTTKKQVIDITSAYKPVLRNAVKINFSGSHLTADTPRPVQPYRVPDQNLFYSYRPVTLRPLALDQDTSLYLGTRNFVKAGFGNYSTPYVSAGVSIGDGREGLLNAYAEYVSSKGKIRHQDYSQLNMKVAGSYFMPRHEVYGSAGVRLDKYFLYGYDHGLHHYTDEEVRRQFQEVMFTGGFRNTSVNNTRINYDPHFAISLFTDKKGLKENSVLVKAPFTKKFGDAFILNAQATADLTNYPDAITFPGNGSSYNNVVQLSPSVDFKLMQVKVHGGVSAAWDNGEFEWLPDINVQFRVKENVFEFQAGWQGKIIKNTFRNMSGLNPYIVSGAAPYNTKETEYYGGIRASLGKHFTFSGKAGWVVFDNLALFLNDTSPAGKGFFVVKESNAKNLRLHGDASFISQDKFTATAGITINGFTGFDENLKAWGMLPMEFTASLRWWAFKRLMLKSDFYLFGGSRYLDPQDPTLTTNGGSDLSAGIEYKFNSRFSGWLDINNIFNDKYQRWRNYEVYGINLLAGIIVHF